MTTANLHRPEPLAAFLDRGGNPRAELGPEPDAPHDHAMWLEERRGAVILLSELADNDPRLLRDAATGEWVHRAARDLLLDAAQECPQAFGHERNDQTEHPVRAADHRATRLDRGPARHRRQEKRREDIAVDEAGVNVKENIRPVRVKVWRDNPGFELMQPACQTSFSVSGDP